MVGRLGLSQGGLFGQQGRQLALRLDHAGIRADDREVVDRVAVRVGPLQLVVHRLPAHALVLHLGDEVAQLVQPRHDEILFFVEGSGVVRFAILRQRVLAVAQLLGVALQLFVEPGQGFLGIGEPLVDVLRGVLFGQGIGRERGERGIAVLVKNLDEPRPWVRHNIDAGQEHADQARLDRRFIRGGRRHGGDRAGDQTARPGARRAARLPG